MYVYGLCLLFDFATKNLHLATIFYDLVDKCDLRILLISSLAMQGNAMQGNLKMRKALVVSTHCP